MAKATTNGRSSRTPCKHSLMSCVFGREVGSYTRLPEIRGAYWVDLTAGDGAGLVEDWSDPEDHAWHKACSPGILLHHARFSRFRYPLFVDLYEQAPATYEMLLANVAEHAPELGYERVQENEWTADGGRVRARFLNADSKLITALPDIPQDWAVQFVNDPNKVSDWAMHPSLVENAARGRWACLGMSTMGCNVAGLKRLDKAERGLWYAHVEAQERGLHGHHDLLLAAIENDDAQWAYLLTVPEKWRSVVETEARRAFDKAGMSLDCAWSRLDPATFHGLQHRLFLTKSERAA